MPNFYLPCEPENLDEVVGHTEAVQLLKNIAARPKELRPHAYLFTGATGIGKSMLIKLFSKKLGCDPDWGFELYTPAEYGRGSIYEDIVRATHYRGFSDAPYKYLYFDECHRMSPALVAKLLDPLQKPKDWIIFFLSVLQVPNNVDWRMIQGRCVQIDLKRLNQVEIATIVTNCAKKFGKTVPDAVMDGICVRAGGHPRDALNRLSMVLEQLPDLV